MNFVKLTGDYEFWKIAHNLAIDFFPIDYDEERKADRERLIDFKDGLRNINKAKHSFMVNTARLEELLAFLNPKRKWTFDDISMLDAIYYIEARPDDLFDLMERGDIRFEEKENYNIYRYLFDHEIYDDEALAFLFKIYDVERPESILGKKPKEYVFEQEYLESALKLVKSHKKNKNATKNPGNISGNI